MILALIILAGLAFLSTITNVTFHVVTRSGRFRVSLLRKQWLDPEALAEATRHIVWDDIAWLRDKGWMEKLPCECHSYEKREYSSTYSHYVGDCEVCGEAKDQHNGYDDHDCRNPEWLAKMASYKEDRRRQVREHHEMEKKEKYRGYYMGVHYYEASGEITKPRTKPYKKPLPADDSLASRMTRALKGAEK